jgi:hypothetical protein
MAMYGPSTWHCEKVNFGVLVGAGAVEAGAGVVPAAEAAAGAGVLEAGVGVGAGRLASAIDVRQARKTSVNRCMGLDV